MKTTMFGKKKSIRPSIVCLTVLAVSLFLAAAAVSAAEDAREQSLKKLLAKYDTAGRREAAARDISPASRALNTEGYRAYQGKDWDRAIELFTRALAADVDNSYAYYNRACTLALKYGQKVPAAVLDRIDNDLSNAGARDPYFAVKLFLDPDLSALRAIDDQFRAYTPGGDSTPATIVKYDDGLALFYHSSLYSMEMELVATGFYARIGGTVFVCCEVDPLYGRVEKRFLFYTQAAAELAESTQDYYG